MWLSNPARHYNCSNESSLFLEQDLINFNSENYLLVQEIQLLLNGLSVLGFIALFACRGLYPKNVSTNAKILLTFFLLTFLGHSFIAMIYKLHYFLMSEIATCISAWVLPFYANAHLLYVVCSNSPFWFLLALIFERLAALMGWRNYETSGPVLAIFLVLIAISGVAVHTIFPYFGSGIIGISIDLTYAHKVRQVNKVKNFFVTVTLFHGTIACLILYCISKRKLMQCKAKLMSPYQLVENVQINCLLLKILTLYLLINLAGDFYLDYVDLPVYRSFLRKNNFDMFSFSGMAGEDDEGFSPLSGLFGMGGGMGARRARRKHQDTVYPLNITLEEAYSGKISKLKITQKGLCKACNGTGSKSGKSTTCTACKGHGMRLQMRQIGPGMVQQIQVNCKDCDGSGDKVVASDRCQECKGTKSCDVPKIHEIKVPPGAQHGEKVRLAGEGNHSDSTAEPGDIIVVFQIKEHSIFTREGDDLIVKHELTLNEALCGFEIGITHLDGRRVILTGKPGEVIVPGSQLGVVGEGMPVSRNTDLKGNLLVNFEVRFPKDHFFDDDSKYKALRSLFPNVKSAAAPAGAEEVSLMEFDENRYGRGRGQAYEDGGDEDEDMEGHGHGPRVQCAQS